MTHADLSPTEYRPPRRAALLAALVIAAMGVLGLWRGVSEELRVGRQAAYLEAFTRNHSAAPTPAAAFTMGADGSAIAEPVSAVPIPSAREPVSEPAAEPAPADAEDKLAPKPAQRAPAAAADAEPVNASPGGEIETAQTDAESVAGRDEGGPPPEADEPSPE